MNDNNQTTTSQDVGESNLYYSTDVSSAAQPTPFLYYSVLGLA